MNQEAKLSTAFPELFGSKRWSRMVQTGEKQAWY